MKELKKYMSKSRCQCNYKRNNAVKEYIFHGENNVKSQVKQSYYTLKVKERKEKERKAE